MASPPVVDDLVALYVEAFRDLDCTDKLVNVNKPSHNEDGRSKALLAG